MASDTGETQVYFELLKRPDRVEGITRLLLRRARLEPHVLVLCPDAAFMASLNEKLWTVHPESFLAHAVASKDAMVNAEQPILLALEITHDNSPEVLVNGGSEVPPDLSGFAHIVDFVDDWDERLKQAARERFSTYRQLGMDPKYLGHAKNGEG